MISAARAGHHLHPEYLRGASAGSESIAVIREGGPAPVDSRGSGRSACRHAWPCRFDCDQVGRVGWRELDKLRGHALIDLTRNKAMSPPDITGSRLFELLAHWASAGSAKLAQHGVPEHYEIDAQAFQEGAGAGCGIWGQTPHGRDCPVPAVGTVPEWLEPVADEAEQQVLGVDNGASQGIGLRLGEPPWSAWRVGPPTARRGASMRPPCARVADLPARSQRRRPPGRTIPQ